MRILPPRAALALAATIMILSSDVTIAQTVALKDLPYFVGKFEVKDTATWRLGKCVEWWRDTVNALQWPARLMAGDTGQRLPSDSIYLYNALITRSWNRQVLTGADSFPSLPIVPQLFYRYPYGSYLTIWERVEKDSARYLASTPAGRGRFNWDTTWIEGTYVFPDTSYLIHVGSAGQDNGSLWGADVFIRYEPPDSFAVVHGSSWSAFKQIRNVYDLSLLRKATRFNSYRVTLTHQYLNHDAIRSPGTPLAIDSASAEVIDLWTLAAQKCHLDTLATWERYR